jgi:hypothetical protein
MRLIGTHEWGKAYVFSDVGIGMANLCPDDDPCGDIGRRDGGLPRTGGRDGVAF